MTLYKFNKLSQQQKISFLEVNGVQIDSRNEANYTIALFQIHAFYVEAYFKRQSIKISKLEAFTGYRKLKPYLEKINLEALFSF